MGEESRSSASKNLFHRRRSEGNSSPILDLCTPASTWNAVYVSCTYVCTSWPWMVAQRRRQVNAGCWVGWLFVGWLLASFITHSLHLFFGPSPPEVSFFTWWGRRGLGTNFVSFTLHYCHHLYHATTNIVIIIIIILILIFMITLYRDEERWRAEFISIRFWETCKSQ